MPLLATTLFDAVIRMTDKDHPDFVGFPATYDDAAANWAAAARAFFEQASVPNVSQLTPLIAHDLCEDAMRAVLGPLFAAQTPTCLNDGFAIYAGLLAANVIVGVGVPPPAPLAIPIQPIFPPPTAETAALALAAAVYGWAITGSVVLPGPIVVPWL